MNSILKITHIIKKVTALLFIEFPNKFWSNYKITRNKYKRNAAQYFFALLCLYLIIAPCLFIVFHLLMFVFLYCYIYFIVLFGILNVLLHVLFSFKTIFIFPYKKLYVKFPSKKDFSTFGITLSLTALMKGFWRLVFENISKCVSMSYSINEETRFISRTGKIALVYLFPIVYAILVVIEFFFLALLVPYGLVIDTIIFVVKSIVCTFMDIFTIQKRETIVDLTLANGLTVKFSLITMIKYKGNNYAVFSPIEEINNEDCDITIVQVCGNDVKKDELLPIEDESLLNTLYQKYINTIDNETMEN